MFDTAYANYTDVNNGYDDQFGYYVTYMQKLVPAVLDTQFMFDQASASDQDGFYPLGPGMNCERSDVFSP